MMRALLLVCVMACGKGDAPAAKHGACDDVRDKYLAWQGERVKNALQGVPPDQRGALQAEADKEAAQAKERFVGACEALGDRFDASCFEHKGFDTDRAHKRHCDDVVHALEAKMFAHP